MNRICIGLFAGAVGCVLAVPLQASKTRQVDVLYSFGGTKDGMQPFANLLDVNGTLYGTTAQGGANGSGTVFELDPTTGKETVVYSFCSQQNCTDGKSPYAGLIDVKGTLYGTTIEGGTYGSGTVFALDPGTGTEQVLHPFGNGTDGASPYASLISVKDTLYGTTQKGGANGSGMVFALDPSTGAEQVLYSFCSQQNCTDGAYPRAGLIDVQGELFGTTQLGGIAGDGTVFALDPDTGAEQVAYSFCSQKNCTDGAFPFAGLLDVNGTLYGTTYKGGAIGYYGTVFALDPQTGAEQVLYSFCSRSNCADGEFPFAGLVDVKGMLYGTTTYGGRYDGGTVFALDRDTGAEQVLYSFCSVQDCTDGGYSKAGLIDVTGTLYGTTQGGGTNGDGTVFALTKP